MNERVCILIISGSSVAVKRIAKELRKGKLLHRLKWVKSAQNFFKVFQAYRPHIVLCDYGTPGFDIAETLKVMREKYPAVPLIIISNTAEESVIKMIDQGAADYLMQDGLNRLVPVLRHALEDKKNFFVEKQVEEKLRQSEEKFSKIFRLSPDSVMVSRIQDGVFIDVNQEFINRIGYTAKELIGHSSLAPDLKIWANTDDRQKVVEQLQATGEITGFETVFRCKSGVLFHGLISSRLVEINGQICMLSLIRDITDRKMFLEALSTSQKQYKLVFENMLNGFALHEMVLDNSGRPVDYIFLEANPAFERMLEVKKDEIIGRKVTEVLPGIQDDPVDWIGKYGAVAAGHGDLKFENYSSVLRKWFSVNAFSPRAGQFVTITEDITERKTAEGRIKENEKFLSAIIENIPNMIFVKDAKELRFLRFNKAGEKLFDRSREEMYGKNDFDFFPEEEARFFVEKDRIVLNTKQGVDIPEEVFRKKTGEERILHTKKMPILDDQNNPVYLLGISEDITDSKRIENELKDSEALFRSYFELPLHGIAVTSPEKGWMQINDQACLMLGYARDEILRMTWAEMTHPEDLAADLEQFERMLSGQIQQYKIDKRFIRKDGKVIWASLAVGCVRKPAGSVDYVISLLQDITERKNMENMLREAETRYRMLFELSPEGIVIIDPQTAKILDFNETAYLQLGYTREEFTALSIYDLEVVESPEETRLRIGKVLFEGRLDFETKQRCRDGEIKDISVTAQILNILGRSVYYCIWRDISERKKTEEEIAKRARELEIFYKASIGREERIIELKKEIEYLRKELNK
ncbi:MAG: PAS domain S-box protein [Candidatus Omnitrophica bacterium]|nr:PAS domain S-box protein [Candidatus Omnitrophota bacterium]